MSRTEDDRVRGLLDEAVADVEPRYALDVIRGRTGAPRRRTRVWAVGGAALATAAAVAAAVWLGGSPGTTGAGPAGRGPRDPGPAHLVYFVGTTGAGPRLFPEPHRAGSASTALDEAVADAVNGTATDLDYRTPWPSGTTAQRAQLAGGVLSVDLSGPVVERPPGMSRSKATLALQQLVLTAQSAAGSRLPVTFLVDGRPAATVLGEPTTRPVPAASPDDVLTSVSVTTPAEGATVTSPVTVTGRASAFEGTVQWELIGDGGAVVKRGFGTARRCCTLSPYSFRVDAAPGSYTLVVHDEDVSDGEGVPPTQDTKRLIVR